MKPETHQQLEKRARDLLALHKGKCSVAADNPLAPIFLEMEAHKEVVTTSRVMCGAAMLDVQQFGFLPIVETVPAEQPTR